MKNNSANEEIDIKLLSKRKLEAFIEEFMAKNQNLINKIKKTQNTMDYGKLYILRCEFFTELVNTLEDHANISDLSTQHDFFKALLHFILHGGTSSDFENRGPENKRFDVKTSDQFVYEVKTRSNVKQTQFLDFIMDYFSEMSKEYKIKRFWWFVMVHQIKFLQPKIINTENCLYYLIVFEIDTRSHPISDLLRTKNKRAMKTHIERMVDSMQKQIKKVEKEDKLIERQAILVPTKNYLLVENLRKEKNEFKRLAEEEKKRADILLKENEELKKKLKERNSDKNTK